MTTYPNYFWNHAYRHEMRDLRPSLKIEVYKAFVDFGLQPDATSDMHQQLIDEIVGDWMIQGEPESNRLERLKYSYPWTYCNVV